MYALYRFNYKHIIYIYILYIFLVVSAGWIKLISKSQKGCFAQPTVRFGRQIFKSHDSLPSQKHRSVASMRAQTQRSFPCRTSPHFCKCSDSGRFLFFFGGGCFKPSSTGMFLCEVVCWMFLGLHQTPEIKETSKCHGVMSALKSSQILSFLLQNFVSPILGHTNTAKHSHENPLIFHSMRKNTFKGPCSIVAARLLRSSYVVSFTVTSQRLASLSWPGFAWHSTSVPRIAWGMHSCCTCN